MATSAGSSSVTIQDEPFVDFEGLGVRGEMWFPSSSHDLFPSCRIDVTLACLGAVHCDFLEGNVAAIFLCTLRDSKQGPMQASHSPPPSSLLPPRKLSTACDTCRRRRVKCDGSQPCSRCVRSKVSCTFGSVIGRTSATSYAHHLEQRVIELETRLREQEGTSTGTHYSCHKQLIHPT